MEIEVTPANRMKLAAFADLHGFKMKVIERSRADLHHSIPYESNRWLAYFDDVEVKEGGCLVGVHGNGRTGAGAVRDYGRKISGKLLIANAFNKETRREIYAPELL